jgi:hypothetical protein
MQTIQVNLSFHTERRQKEGRLGREMDSWYLYLEQGLSRKVFKDRIGGPDRNHIDLKEDLKNLQPFVVEHWKKGLLGIVLTILVTLRSFSQPLIHPHLIWV